MKQEIISINFNGNHQPQLTANILFPSIAATNPNAIKPCKFRTDNGYCTRSNRQCPATFLTIILNN